MSERRCECEPIVWDDGSKSHEDDCPMYPWCPHEVVAASCFIPCGCQCAPCLALVADTPDPPTDTGDRTTGAPEATGGDYGPSDAACRSDIGHAARRCGTVTATAKGDG